MNQTSHAIGKQDVNLQWLNQRGYLSLTKSRVHHGLSGPVGASLIVGRARIKFASCVRWRLRS